MKTGCILGHENMGEVIAGGQAELLRVPYGDYNCPVLPEDAREKENDYLM